ncbi:MAG: hypothetical protein LBU11_11620 [Zoogloeaceae bacterium]|jgi:hypothetical protein|nr:hypothetical protein [Zoogloeaceae bacterium]
MREFLSLCLAGTNPLGTPPLIRPSGAFSPQGGEGKKHEVFGHGRAANEAQTFAFPSPPWGERVARQGQERVLHHTAKPRFCFLEGEAHDDEIPAFNRTPLGPIRRRQKIKSIFSQFDLQRKTPRLDGFCVGFSRFEARLCLVSNPKTNRQKVGSYFLTLPNMEH